LNKNKFAHNFEFQKLITTFANLILLCLNVMTKVKRPYLIPAACVYGFFMRIRNFLFDIGIIKEKTFPDVLIVNVGNLSVGGTGKTPHTEFLINKLADNHKVAVLSRGYNRKTKGFRVAKAGDTSQTVGDEPLQFFSKFKNIVVAVDENRCIGISNILKLYPKIEIIILDDAFQHRFVKPDINIMLTDYFDMYNDDFMFPAGNLREHAVNVKRADFVIVTKCDWPLSPIIKHSMTDTLKLRKDQQLLFSSIVYDKIKPVAAFEDFDTSNKKYTTAVCFSGIANNYWFIQKVKSVFDDVEIIEYQDHHEYSVDDVNYIVKKYKDNYGNRKVIITTEKDAMRLNSNDLRPLIKDVPIYYLPIYIYFHDNGEKLLMDKIENILKQKKQSSHL
jgi:tetraacyldisaccharide 4'-kinase